jgi:UDP-N-acetylmuramoyl-tripeptide--D-alanyl-D-alanine ligase
MAKNTNLKQKNNIKVCLDSRQVKKGEYFVPVVGDTFDGHKFIEEALKNGAAGVIEEKDLYEIASEKLKKINPVVIGVAGAVGKSTFRSYLVSVLSKKYKVLDGNLNTKLGIATNIVNALKDSHKVLVAEMGIDRLGEMSDTADFLKPNFVVITKLEKEHLQFLKSFKNAVNENFVAVQKSKERFGYVNLQDKKLVEPLVKKENIEYFSFHKDIKSVLEPYNFPPHEKDYLDCIYKIATDRFKFSKSDFDLSIKSLKRPKGRLNLIKGKNESLIIDDSYNAVCDTSVTKGIDFAKSLAKKQLKDLSIVLSPIRETGKSLKEQHKSVANYLNKNKFKNIYLIGDTGEFYIPHLKTSYVVVKDSSKFAVVPKSTDLFYVKGSQFYRCEKCVKKLMANPGNAKKLLVRQDIRWQ